MTGDEYFLFSDFSDFSNIFEITEKAEARICETAVGLECECVFFKEIPVSSSMLSNSLDLYFMTEPKSRHPNVLKIVGISDKCSKSHFKQTVLGRWNAIMGSLS